MIASHKAKFPLNSFIQQNYTKSLTFKSLSNLEGNLIIMIQLPVLTETKSVKIILNHRDFTGNFTLKLLFIQQSYPTVQE